MNEIIGKYMCKYCFLKYDKFYSLNMTKWCCWWPGDEGVNSWHAELFLRSWKTHSHLLSCLESYSTEEEQIHYWATLHVTYPILSIPCLLMPWWLEEPGHQQAWFWLNKPEYSVCSIRRVKSWLVWKRNTHLVLTHYILSCFWKIRQYIFLPFV